MKLTNKRLWKGEKAEYYPAFKYALTDSLLFSVLWVVIISLLLSTICLIIHFTNGSNMSWEVIAFVYCILNLEWNILIRELVQTRTYYRKNKEIVT